MKIGKTLGFIRNTGVFVLFTVVAAGVGCKHAEDPFAKFNPYDQELGKRIEEASSSYRCCSK
ncbi:hypothetical protein [Pedobacter sp. NJ-S-72]